MKRNTFTLGDKADDIVRERTRKVTFIDIVSYINVIKFFPVLCDMEKEVMIVLKFAIMCIGNQNKTKTVKSIRCNLTHFFLLYNSEVS